MVRTVRHIEQRVLPHGWSDLARQLLLFAAAYYAYQIVRGAADGKAAAAAWNATNIIGLEQSLNLFIEPSIQAWAASTGWIADVTAWLYINSHFVVTVGGLAFIYLFRNPSFYFVRNMFMVAMVIALFGYALFPTAPPRLMPEWGFTDTVASFTGVRAESNTTVSALVNLYAAVPSMHCAFALMIGWPLARLVRPAPLKALWALYPALVFFVVVATGNHYVFDAVLGAATAGVSALLSQQLARWRPQAWSFRVSRAEATA